MSSFRSGLYECRVMHHRLAPTEHQFRHNIFMFWIDLDELGDLSDRLPLFNRNRFNAYSFYDRDHLAQEGESVKENVQTWLRQQGVETREDDRIMLLTFPRAFGYVFNPVSFFFCFRESGESLCAIAEVGNTFKEKKRYLLRDPGVGRTDGFELTTLKHFYVSPFSELDVKFNFRLGVPGKRLAIRVDDYEGAKRTLLTVLTGRHQALTGGRLAWFSIKYPLITLKVIVLIHWHALRLHWKKTPFIRKAAHPERQLDVLHRQKTWTPHVK